jgi:acetolactate synthase I/II/III large subunit
MNGAESLVRTLINGGIDACFSNPGTSEMHFVAALDRVAGMRSVLCLFEGVATGAADGYARMRDKPAITLLHLGPGLANGLANLHNARRARSPILNIVGEHATYHLRHDAPLTSDIEGFARPVSHWLRTSRSATAIAADAAEAIQAAATPPGQIATLILPANTAWEDGGAPAAALAVPQRAKVSPETIRHAASVLESGVPTLLLLSNQAVRAKALQHAAKIAAKTNCKFMAQVANARMERGAGRISVERVPYPVELAVQTLAPYRQIFLIGARPPVAYFAYPGKPSELQHPDCVIETLAGPECDLIDALASLADAVGAAGIDVPPETRHSPPIPGGACVSESLAAALGTLIPENAIIVDESVTTGRGFFPLTKGAAPHDWLQITGGSIGMGLPCAVGAAVACPDRKVISLQSDGSGMYTVQALWTQARENLNVLTLIWANRAYAILRRELSNVGALNPGPTALDMLSLDNPPLDWVAMAAGMGVAGERVETMPELVQAMRSGLAEKGPYLIEVAMA